MSRLAMRSLLMALVLSAAAGCGYAASATFNADGSVVVGLKFTVPTALMQQGGVSGQSIQGLSPADIQKANDDVAKKFPGAKVVAVNEGDETGALITIPFKNEKDAFAFLTQPSTMNPTQVAGSGSSPSIDLSNTGGIFATATHTTSGPNDTYTFTTAVAPVPSPGAGSSPSETQALQAMESVFTVTFVLTVPNEITSAPGALFTLDRKTAIWTLSYTKAQTFTAITSSTNAGLASNRVEGPNVAVTIGIALVAIVVGFVVGLIRPWGRFARPVVAAPAYAPSPASGAPAESASGAPATQPPEGIRPPPQDLPPPHP